MSAVFVLEFEHHSDHLFHLRAFEESGLPRESRSTSGSASTTGSGSASNFPRRSNLSAVLTKSAKVNSPFSASALSAISCKLLGVHNPLCRIVWPTGVSDNARKNNLATSWVPFQVNPSGPNDSKSSKIVFV